MTNSRDRVAVPLPREELDQLGALALGETADRLRLADPALVQEPGRLDAAELRHGEQHVEHLRREQELRRVCEDAVDRRVTNLQVALEPCPLDTNLVRPAKRLHALV